MNKLVKVTAATGLALTMGVATLAPVVSEAASVEGNVIYQDAYKTIKTFSKSDLQTLTGVSLTAGNVDKVYNKLTEAATWADAGYTNAQASKIAQRVSAYTNQLKGILREIAAKDNVSLKVIYLDKTWNEQINFGSEYTGGNVVDEDNNDNGTIVEPGDDTEDNSGNNNESVKPSTGKLAVKDLDVEIEYKNFDVELQYEVKKNGKVEAEYENEFTGEKVKGAKAQSIIEGIFADFDMNSTNKNQIVTHVLGELKLKNNFKKFQYEVEFPNKSEFEFKIK
ncbi:YusW family protein [Listeria valentina]|uniref:YusW family protein n=1 Tax=Listeria valentina TaxID=2705293 RepID=UPI00142F5955|nr:YusW family protein [Listeria valentina]